jgi:hypothetical protein
VSEMADVPKYIDLRQFVDFGFLQEVNRQFLHPLGLSLAVEKDAKGGARFVGILDSRDDPEGFIFGFFNDDDLAKAEQVAAVREEKAAARMANLGFIVEPIGRCLLDLRPHTSKDPQALALPEVRTAPGSN